MLTERTFCREAGVCGVGVFGPRFADFQLGLLEVLRFLLLLFC